MIDMTELCFFTLFSVSHVVGCFSCSSCSLSSLFAEDNDELQVSSEQMTPNRHNFICVEFVYVQDIVVYKMSVLNVQFFAIVSRWPMTASVMGSIMAVAAVLLTHIDRNHVGNMKPNSNLQENVEQLRKVTASG